MKARLLPTQSPTRWRRVALGCVAFGSAWCLLCGALLAVSVARPQTAGTAAYTQVCIDPKWGTQGNVGPALWVSAGTYAFRQLTGVQQCCGVTGGLGAVGGCVTAPIQVFPVGQEFSWYWP